MYLVSFSLLSSTVSVVSFTTFVVVPKTYPLRVVSALPLLALSSVPVGFSGYIISVFYFKLYWVT